MACDLFYILSENGFPRGGKRFSQCGWLCRVTNEAVTSISVVLRSVRESLVVMTTQLVAGDINGQDQQYSGCGGINHSKPVRISGASTHFFVTSVAVVSVQRRDHVL